MSYGGKADQLIELQKCGYKIPPFVVLGDITVKEIIEGKLNAIKYIENYFDEIPRYYAVRSSAQVEDGRIQSYAGIFHSELFVDKENLKDAITKVDQSKYLDRVQQYATRESIHMNIIIQEMIDAETSGVAFSINPLTGDPYQKIINSTFGLGEGIVSGELNADQYIISNKGIEYKLAEKTHQRKWDQNKNRGTVLKLVDDNYRTESSLSENQIYELSTLLSNLNAKYKHAVDIEFCYNNNQLYLLQCRPVTTSISNVIIYDNSNIIESYPGLTLPLTFSFIQKMYRAVYEQLSELLGINKEKISTHHAMYENMLALLHGRVYYNLNSWFGVLSLLPMYHLNASAMEKMMGVKEPFDIELSLPKTSRWQAYIDTIWAIIKMLKSYIQIPSQTKKFRTNFSKILEQYNAIKLSDKNIHQLLKIQSDYEKILLKEWKVPMVNDFFAMILFASFHKFVKNNDANSDSNLHNELLISDSNIITTEPIQLHQELLTIIKESDYYTQLFKNETSLNILLILKERRDNILLPKIELYIFKWGSRCVGELKLETITYHEKPEALIDFLISLINNQSLIPINPVDKQQKNKLAVIRMESQLSWFKKIVFQYLLRKTRFLVSNRENLRYNRTLAYGFVRKIYRGIGDYFVQKKVIESQEDVFYLNQEEIVSYAQGTSIHSDLKAIINLRKSTYIQYQPMHLAERIRSINLPYQSMCNTSEFEVEYEDKFGGIPCCSGIVEAEVCVVEQPNHIPSLNGRILVTSSTDPGWIGLFPSAGGILVERGSLLSHSAIVSREMGIPCIVGIKNLLQQLKSGDRVEMNGATGMIKILSRR